MDPETPPTTPPEFNATGSDSMSDEINEVVHQLVHYFETASSRPIPRPCRTRPFSGHELVVDILRGHPNRCVDEFRMSVEVFNELRAELESNGTLRNTHISAQEKLAIFLHMVSHSASNRALSEKFQHSGESISRHIKEVARAIADLRFRYIKLPNIDTDVDPHPRIRDSTLFSPFFRVSCTFLL